MLKIWREGEKLVLSKNPRYFETDSAGFRLPYLDAISITFITEKQSEFLEFMKGNLDFLSGVQTAYKDVLFTRSGLLNPKYQERFQLLTQPYLNTEYLGFMLDHSLIKHPYQQKALRKAINYGFNRTEMMKYLRNNLGTPAYNGFIPKGLPAFDNEIDVYRYNPDSARRLLAQSGFPNGKGLQPITLTTTADYVDICEYIQHELAGVGIPVQIEVSNGATFREMVAHSKLPFFRGSWIADYPDAENYLSLFYSKNFSPSGPNTTHFKNIEYDRLYEKALLETDEDKRNEIYRRMNRIIVEEAPVIPLFYDMVVRICPVSIKNFSGNAMNILRLKRVRKI
jgi:peptide/nickel transport system substrate-binding protein